MTDEIKKLIDHRQRMKKKIQLMMLDVDWYRAEIKKITACIDRKVAEERRLANDGKINKQ